MKTILGTSESDLHIRGWGRLRGQIRIQNWIQFFKAWELSILRYYERTDHDLPWWYTERANISLLAAAAWLCGGIALEEYPIEKGFCGDNYEGRADLYLTIGEEGYAIEGKAMKVSLNFKDIAVPMKGLIETLAFQLDGEPYPIENADFLGCLLMAKVYHPCNGGCVRLEKAIQKP